ncbi:MAG: sensor domain-containing diguanylate cyclase [Vicinamibacterales bacterium]
MRSSPDEVTRRPSSRLYQPDLPVDPIEQLGSTLEAISTDVARREEELNRLVRQIRVERNQLLDAVLNRMFEGFSGFIPFDRIICSFLADRGASTVAYWMRARESAVSIPVGYTSPVADSGFYELLRHDRPLIIDDLPTFVASRPSSDLLHRLADDGARSSLTCPLIADGAPLGFLLFTSNQGSTYQPHHIAAFQRLAEQVSIVVQKTRSYGQGLTQGKRLLAEKRRLQQAATTDTLTGVLNRRGLDEALARAWRRHSHGHGTFGVIMCDVDRFKDVNDTHGHAVGDRVLAETAHRLSQGLRSQDVFGRYGGEEFLAVVDTADDGRLVEVAERLRSLVGRAPLSGIRVTASFGVAVAARHATLPGLCVSVDRALYAAKQQGRDRCVLAQGD